MNHADLAKELVDFLIQKLPDYKGKISLVGGLFDEVALRKFMNFHKQIGVATMGFSNFSLGHCQILTIFW